MKHNMIIAALLAFTMQTVQAQEATPAAPEREYSYIYRVYLADKQGTASINRPEELLSPKALQRRARQGLGIDSTDLPVSPQYVKQIKKQAQVIGTSRWLNTVLVKVTDTTAIKRIEGLKFVTGTHRVWILPDRETPLPDRKKYTTSFSESDSVANNIYGKGYRQIAVMGGDSLHAEGFRGKGMTIAVIDGGFCNADVIPSIQKINILGTRDFVCEPRPNIYYDTSHGTGVLSCMGLNEPNVFIGTAPEASFWLLRSEDGRTEQEVEEDYWVMAAEFADSVGVDVINTSLGYNNFDDPTTSHKYWQLDGHTAFISRGASLLAGKGIVLVCSAGNSGDEPWKKITPPADADNVLTVGALNRQLVNANFSSLGPSQDGRVKPDIMAIGNPSYLMYGEGEIIRANGTSFSSPTACGMVACLWQALPHLTAYELMDIIRKSSDNYSHPDNIYGYGLPNFWQAYLKNKTR
jgi:subtilisin family serine protease